MKFAKMLAAVAAFTTMGLSTSATAFDGGIILPGPIYTVEQCDDLSRRIDIAYRGYLANPTPLAYQKYLALNSEYNRYCDGIPHTY